MPACTSPERTRSCLPTCSCRPSRRCSPSSFFSRSRGTCSAQPSARRCQRRRACSRCSCSRGAAMPGIGAPSMRTSRRSESVVTATGTKSRRVNHRLSSPLPSRRRTPPAANSGDRAWKSTGSAPSQASPLPRVRSTSSTAVNGSASAWAQARTPTRRRSPLTRRRRSMRGSVVSMPNVGERTPVRPRSPAARPAGAAHPADLHRRRTVAAHAPTSDRLHPAADPAPAHAGATRSANGRQQAAVHRYQHLGLANGRPRPAPICRPLSCSNGPRRVQAVCSWSKRTGWPARSLSRPQSCRGGARPAAAAG